MATDVSRTRTASAARYDSFVAAQLDQAERRIRTLDLTAALLGWLAATLAYLVLMVLLDSKLDLSEATRRTALYCFLAASAAYSWFFILRPLRRRINPYYAARQVEQLLPDAKNSVVNWVDLHNEKLPPVIRGALGQRAARDLGQVDLQQAISGRRTGWTGGLVGAGVVAFLVCCFLLGPVPFFSFLARTFSPFSNKPAATRTRLTILSPEAGNTVLTVGRPFGALVEVQGRIPDVRGEDALKLQYRYEEDEPFLERPLQLESGREWKGSLGAPEVRNGFWYRIVGGDAATPVYRVDVRAAPALTAFLATYHYRPYVGRADEVSRQRELHGVRGTEVVLRARTNRLLREARLDFVSKTRLTSVPGTVSTIDAQNLEVRFVLEEEGQYRLHFTSDGSETYLDPRFYSVVVSPDQAPVVELTRPGSDVTMPANGLLRLEGKANDDLGIKDVVLRMQVHPGPHLAPRPYRSEKAFALEGGGFPREVAYKDFVDFRQLKSEEGQAVQLKAGMDLEYWLEASDACDYPRPNVGESKHYHVHIADPDRSDPKNLDKQRQQAEEDKRKHDAQQDRKLQKESQARQQERQEQQERNQEEERKNEQTQQQADKGQGGDSKQSGGKSEQDQGKDKQGDDGKVDSGKDDASAKKDQGDSSKEDSGKKDDKQKGDRQDKQEQSGGADSKQDPQGGDKGAGQDGGDKKAKQGDKGGSQEKKDNGLSKEQKDLLDRIEKSLKKDEQQKGDGNDNKSDQKQGDKKADGQDRQQGDSPQGDKQQGDKPKGDKQQGDKQQGGKPEGDKGGKPSGDPADKRQDNTGKPDGTGSNPKEGPDKGKPDASKPDQKTGKPGDKGTDAGNPKPDKTGKTEPGDKPTADKGKPEGDRPEGDRGKPQDDKPAAENGKPEGNETRDNKTDGSDKGKPQPNPSDRTDTKDGSGQDKPTGGDTQPADPGQRQGGKDGGEASKEDIDKLMKDLRSNDPKTRQKALDSLEKASKEATDPRTREASKKLLEREREWDKLMEKSKGDQKSDDRKDKGSGDKGDKSKPDHEQDPMGASTDKGKPMPDKGTGADKGKPEGGDKGDAGEKSQPGADKGKPGDKGSGDKGKPTGDKQTGEPKGNGQQSSKQGDGNKPGNGASGPRKNEGESPEGTPRKKGGKTADPRDTMLQLEKLDKDALRKVLKDAQIAPEDWEKFRAAYRRQMSKQAASGQETTPGHNQGGGALPTVGGKVKSEGKVEGSSNRALPPPQYRSSFREFNRRLSDIDANSK